MEPSGDASPEAYSHRGVVVLNPVAGDESHATQVRGFAAEFGFEIVETERDGHAVELAREAVEDGATLVLACGGDGTVNEVVRGIDTTGGFDDVTVAVVPAGTGNNFAGNVGVDSIREGFEVAVAGDRRTVDLGEVETPDGETRVFVNSCIAGITAESSAATDPDAKSRLGVVAYVVETLRRLDEFGTLDLRITTDDGDVREVEALMLLAGNGRRFPVDGRTQADMEDGKLDVTVVEGRPGFDLASKAAVARFFGEDSEDVSRRQTGELELVVDDDETTTFSLDGEMVESGSLTIRTRPSVLTLRVGESYEPHSE